ncbi:MAG TPA: hypothetical protein VN639_08770 [Azonexus sp.]|nr:hypothetical protein [Azonexus sp.]
MTRVFIYDGCTVEPVAADRGMDIFTGRLPMIEHACKIIWFVEVCDGAVSGLSPVPIDEKGYARQNLVMHRILIVTNRGAISEGWPADDLQARRYVDAMKLPPNRALLLGKIRNLKAAASQRRIG